MKAVSLERCVGLAIWAGLMIWAVGAAPALALPNAAPTMTERSAAAPPFLVPAQWPFPLTAGWPFLLPAGHHGHHGHWGHRHERWSREAPPYGPAPEINATEAPVPGYAPATRYLPTAGSTQPPAAAPPQSMTNRAGTAPMQASADRASQAPAAAAPSAPSIQWVNPDRAAR